MSMENKKTTFIDILFLFLIAINVLDFFEKLTPELALIDNLISWSLMIYLLYKLGFTNILIGYKEKVLEIFLLISYSIFIIKDLLFYLLNSELKEVVKYEAIILFIEQYQNQLKFYSFTISAALMILLAIYIARKVRIEEKSMLGAFNADKRNVISRFLIALLCISFASYFIFMIAFQWFAIVIDAPLVMIAMVYYFIAARKYHQEGSKVRRIADFGETVVDKFVEFFHKRETIHLGLISLLILHFFTDIFVFVVPSFLKITSSVYSGALSYSESQPLYQLFVENITGKDLFTIINIFLIYAANVAFVMTLFILPILILKSIYEEKSLDMKSSDMMMMLTFLPLYFIFPIYKIVSISSGRSAVSGVNIILQPVKDSGLIQLVLPMMLLFFLISLIIYKYSFIEDEMFAIIFVFIPIIVYVKNYFTSTVYYYVEMIRNLLALQNILIILFLLIFLLLIVYFYWMSLGLFVYHTFRLNFLPMIFGSVDAEKEKKLFAFLIFMAIIYLASYYLSTILLIFHLRSLDFLMPIIITFILLFIHKFKSFFERVSFGFNLKNILITPLVLLLGLLFGVSFVYFREPLGYNSEYLIIVIAYLVFVSISEELMFRNYLHHYSKEALTYKKAIFFQSIVFAALHLTKGINFSIFIALFLFAIAATIIKEKAGLFNAIIFHLIANLFLYFNHLIVL